MRRGLARGGAAALGVMLAASGLSALAAGGLVANGGFETPDVPGDSQQFDAGAALDGWLVNSGSVDILSNRWQPAEGAQSLDLTGNSPGRISQPLGTTAGTRYQLSFALSGNPEGGANVMDMTVHWDGAEISQESFNTSGHSLGSMGWIPRSIVATAGGASTLLEFRSLENGVFGPAIDDVEVTAIPAAPDPIVSDFTDSRDGWGIFTGGETGVPQRPAAGGNPDGHLRSLDPSDGRVTYWDAPAKYLGDRSASYARQLAFHLRSFTSNGFEADDVVLEGAERTLVFELGANPGTDWTQYTVPLQEGTGWTNTASGLPATATDMQAVLADLDALRIRAEYSNSSTPDTGDLDNVSMGQTAPPPPDSDGDGVPDASDACPAQFARTANGCPPPAGPAPSPPAEPTPAPVTDPPPAPPSDEPQLPPSIETAASLEQLSNPEPFREANVDPERGEVFVTLPRGFAAAAQAPKGRIPLRQAAQLPLGSTIHADTGLVRVESSADSRGRRQQIASFSDGTFEMRQARSTRPITEMVLKGGSFRTCPRAKAGVSARRNRRVRRLWGDGRGRFRTRGRYSSATVRGTRWLTEDRCDGTLTRVRRGSVVVNDFRRRRAITVSAGRSYLARPR